MSGMDRLTEREWLISLLTIEQEQMLTDYEVHPDAWKGDPERTDCIAALADGIIDGLAHRRASQAAPAPVAYRVRFAGEGAGDWAMASPESAVHYIGRDGYECQPLYATPAPSDGLRDALEMPDDFISTWHEVTEWCAKEGETVEAQTAWGEVTKRLRAALTPAPAQEGGE